MKISMILVTIGLILIAIGGHQETVTLNIGGTGALLFSFACGLFLSHVLREARIWE